MEPVLTPLISRYMISLKLKDTDFVTIPINSIKKIPQKEERRLFDKIPKPFIYLRFVDDTFVSFRSRSDALSFVDKLNQLHSSLTFTMEEENNWSIAIFRSVSRKT